MRPLVEARDLVRHFDVSAPWLERWTQGQPRQVVRAVDGVSFAIAPGETLALVGESGSGKSTVARLLLGLYEPSAGRVVFDGQDVTALLQAGRGSAALRRRLQMIFQDPYASLNPRWTVHDIVAEPIVEQGRREPRWLAERVGTLLEAVGLRASDAERYPHQFSGGQRQRVSIARALAGDPAFVVCDEPTSALDVSVQAQVLNLMKDLQRERRLTYLFISHNLAVVRHVADRVAVMYLGRIVELAPKHTLFTAPRHPYTRLLLDAIPDIARRGAAAEPAPSDTADALQPPNGCSFHPRCPHALERCRAERPALLPSSDGDVACHAVSEGRL